MVECIAQQGGHISDIVKVTALCHTHLSRCNCDACVAAKEKNTTPAQNYIVNFAGLVD